jgi:hypothetical protein
MTNKQSITMLKAEIKRVEDRVHVGLTRQEYGDAIDHVMDCTREISRLERSGK